MMLRLLLATLVALTGGILHAEGTKQLSPTANDTTVLIVNNSVYSSFASVAGPDDSRLQFRLAAPGQERVYFGFSNGFRGIDSIDYPAAAITYYYRVLDPTGAVALDWTTVAANDPNNLNTYAQVLAGPAAITAGGYPAVEFLPGTGAVAGDYTLEISSATDGSNPIPIYIPRFDVTVATRDVVPVELPGRLFSLNWAIGCPPTKDFATSPYGAFDRQFNGQLFVYSPEGFVSKVDFNGAGFQPYFFNISFNGDGVVGYLDPLSNLKSIEDARSTNASYEIFLQEPPASLYPSGTLGTMLDNSDYPKLLGCAGGNSYYVEVAVTNSGIVEVLIDEDAGDNTFTYNSADRMISAKITPRPGEVAPYVRQIPWDGKDGLGNHVADNANLSARVTFSQVPYHLPVYDAEFMLNGFNVTMVRPSPPAGYTFSYQWDDSGITEPAPVGSTKVNLEGCTSSCHTWDDFGYGDQNTVNTFWYARREASSQTFNRVDPACGCSVTGVLTVGGSVFDDEDGSMARSVTEPGFNSVDVYLYEDVNGNGMIDGTDAISQTTQTTIDGNFGFSVNTSGTPGTSDTRTTNSNGDGSQIFSQFYPQYSGLGAYTADGTANDVYLSLHFNLAAIPAYAAITNAYIEVTGGGVQIGTSVGGSSNVVLYAENSPNPENGTGTALVSGRSRTVAEVNWSIPAEGPAGTVYTSPSITAIINELITTNSYDENGAIHLIGLGSGNYIQLAGFEDNPAAAPRLVVEYTDYDLPKSYVIAIDQTDVPSSMVLLTDDTEAVTLYEPDDFACSNLFGFGDDRDADGVADAIDLDNDNDGIPDAEENGSLAFSPTGDEDGDGILNFEDLDDTSAGFTAASDANSDGIVDGFDTDMDGVPDVYDLDSDNDGLPDLLEAGGTDTNGDGRIDDATDSDGDGLVDTYDNNDTDGPLGNGTDTTSPSTSQLTDPAGLNTPSAPDADGDGLADYLDLDSDNDGISDVIEGGGTDTQGDGYADGFVDTDGDGLNDILDGDVGNDGTAENSANALLGVDTDQDGIVDYKDLDSDNDGVPDVVEAGGTDANGDGRSDNFADTDNDGLNDVIDGDANNDGTAENTANALVVSGPDTNNDGRPDSYVQHMDTDGDGISNQKDLDSDNDGIPDLVEAGGTDTDGDGRADTFTDVDSDGFTDFVDGDPSNSLALGNDSNGTNAANALVPTGADGNNDGQPDSYPANDTDGDGLLDHLDLDADNDGITDVVESGGIDQNGDGTADNFTDADNDGLNDAVDGDLGNDGVAEGSANALVLTGADTDADGKPNSYPTDLDQDGFLAHVDLDQDQDGIPDLIEARGVDTNGDGRIDVSTDADNDGLADIVDGDNNTTPTEDDGNGALVVTDNTGGIQDSRTDQQVDFDGDGIPNFADRDSDNDGLSDLLEAGITPAADANQDGRLDSPVDLDGDGLADAYDGDGNDGPLATGGGNADGIPVVLTAADSDGDGSSLTEGFATTYQGTDTDGRPDFIDLDSDNDGITDVVEQAGGLTTTDAGSGSLNGQMEHLPGVDFVVNTTYAALDSDGDGIPDYRDIDADNDGIPDNLEATCTGCPTAGGYTSTDANRNGVSDAFEGLTPTNATGGSNTGVTPVDFIVDGNGVDYLDLDTDDDGAFDYNEGFDNDGNGSALNDYLVLAAAYESNNGSPGDYTNADADSDGIPDWLDNQPAVTGYDETLRPPYLDPNSAFWIDANANGLADLVDASAGGVATSLPDEDNLNDADWRDAATAAPLPVELISFSASASNCEINVSWLVASEENFAYYEVELATSATDFKAFAKTLPVSGRTSEKQYQEQLAALDQVTYVRLAMYDLDGSVAYSQVVAVTSTCKQGTSIGLFPNPVRPGGMLTVEHAPQGELSILDASGRLIRTVISKGSRTEIELAGLHPGVYLIRSQTGSALRFVVH